MDLSIIVVNYNTRDLTIQALDSIFRNADDLILDVIIVNNASNDNSVIGIKSRFPQVRIIENKDNVGFSAANNQAMDIATGRYVLLLNSDTIVQGNCLFKCLSYMDKHPEIGALGCKVLLADGSLDHACKRGFPTPEASLYYFLHLDRLFPQSHRFGNYNLTYLSPDVINEVDVLTGAFMMLRREVIDTVGALDESFFMYGEDIDWCYRIKEAGWKVVYYPEATIVHLKGGSGGRKSRRSIYEFYRSMGLFYNKHYRQKYPRWVENLVYWGIGLKYRLEVFKQFRK